MDHEEMREMMRRTSPPLAFELDEIKTAITLDLCSEIEETRSRISGVTSAVGGLVLPAYIAAISLAVIAFSIVTA